MVMSAERLSSNFSLPLYAVPKRKQLRLREKKDGNIFSENPGVHSPF